jgi:hypothetical protein
MGILPDISGFWLISGYYRMLGRIGIGKQELKELWPMFLCGIG